MVSSEECNFERNCDLPTEDCSPRYTVSGVQQEHEIFVALRRHMSRGSCHAYEYGLSSLRPFFVPDSAQVWQSRFRASFIFMGITASFLDFLPLFPAPHGNQLSNNLIIINLFFIISLMNLSLRPSPGHQLLQLSLKLPFKRSLVIYNLLQVLLRGNQLTIHQRRSYLHVSCVM